MYIIPLFRLGLLLDYRSPVVVLPRSPSEAVVLYTYVGIERASCGCAVSTLSMFPGAL